MRSRSAPRRARAALPAALAGSIALALTLPTTAHAAGGATPAAQRSAPGAARADAASASVDPTFGAAGRSGVSAAVPAAAVPGGYTVQPGDTVFAIARRHGLRTADVLAWNGLTPASVIRPGQVLTLTAPTAPAPPASASATQLVRAGDTVTAIARRHGVTTAALLAANGLTADSIIYPGQRLAIPAAASSTGLDAEQTANARLIISVGRSLGVSDRGIAIGLGTAMQESWLRNLDWGDRDSLGLFQQRPSAGWGTAAEARNAERAVRAFFGGPGDPNGSRTRGLLDIPGWESMSFADAAQAVQRSAHPERYAQWERPAAAWLAALG